MGERSGSTAECEQPADKANDFRLGGVVWSDSQEGRDPGWPHRVDVREIAPQNIQCKRRFSGRHKWLQPASHITRPVAEVSQDIKEVVCILAFATTIKSQR